MLARACGKTDVHSLEPEDLCALTVEASAMARVPLAGTEYIPGVSEERTLARIERLLERHIENPIDYLARRRGGDPMSDATAEVRHLPGEPEKVVAIDAEYLSGKRFAYQEDMSLVEDVDLVAATPGEDINWLEDVTLLAEEGVPAVFDRYSNSFIKIYFEIPEGREDEIARKVLIKHLQSGNSYGIILKERHASSRSRSSGPWVAGSRTVGTDYKPSVLEGWEPPVAPTGVDGSAAARS